MARTARPIVRIDSSEWNRFAAVLASDKFGKSVSRDLRKRLKELSGDAVSKVQAKLAEPTPAGNAPGDGLNAISESLKTIVSFRNGSGGVKVTASSRGLPAAHKGLLLVYNTKVFRNPEDKTGRGNPYFGAVLRKAFDENLIKEMQGALAVAAHAIGVRGI